jgi:hypothetical protein
MDEFGNPVGLSTIQADGATQSVYIREDSGNIEYSTDNLTWNIFFLPIGIQNTNTASATHLKVLFTNNITLSNTSDYFFCSSDYIQFGSDSLNGDGSRPEITINNVTNYPGLIWNGDSGNNGYSYIKVLNLKVLSTGTTSLASPAGWIGHSYFAKGATNNFIINCSSTGEITSRSGGIVGEQVGGELNIYNSSSTGIISGARAGGIVGSIDNIGNVSLNSCSSTGAISGSETGGIIGRNGINSTVANCYSTGIISGTKAGGIFGRDSQDSSATNCYSTGNITGQDAGGIFGAESGVCQAINCYSSGSISGTNAGGIFGPISTTPTTTNCYAANGTWSDSTANTNLTGEPTTSNVGTTWVKTGVNVPYQVKTAGFSPYSLNNISGTTLNTTYTETLAVGATSAASVVGSSFSITDINGSLPSVYSTITIDGTTGAINVGAGTVPDTYVLVVNCTINPYAYSTVTLTVGSGSTPLTTDCCISLKDMKYLTAETVTTVRAGNNIVAVAITNPKNKFRSYDSYLRYKTTAASKKRN